MKNKGKDKITKLFSSPLSNVISLVIAIISIILAIYFYKTGKEKRELMFYCNPIKTTLIKGGQISSLEVYVNNEKITQDITAVQIAVWNNGKKPIERSDILKDVIIYSDPKVPFISAEIYKIPRDVIALKINKDHLADGYIPISWKILEQNDGGIIQIIYKGGPDIKILMKGTIKGQKEITAQSFKGKILSQKEQLKKIYEERFILKFTLFFASLYMLMIFFYLNLRLKKIKSPLHKYRNMMKITAGISSIIFFIIFLILMTQGKFKTPPFGF